MKVDRPHRLTLEEAVARCQALTEYWRVKYGVRSDWTGSRARIDGNVRGVKFAGGVEVGDRSVRADIKAGLLAEALGGRGYVERKLDDYLDPSRSLEELRARAR